MISGPLGGSISLQDFLSLLEEYSIPDFELPDPGQDGQYYIQTFCDEFKPEQFLALDKLKKIENLDWFLQLPVFGNALPGYVQCIVGGFNHELDASEVNIEAAQKILSRAMQVADDETLFANVREDFNAIVTKARGVLVRDQPNAIMEDENTTLVDVENLLQLSAMYRYFANSNTQNPDA